jgi:transcriptional regulator with XRE-family HTH domain
MEAQIGNRIREARAQAGLTQLQLGVAIGASPSDVCRWESGKTVPQSPTVAAIARALRVSSDYLLGLEPEPAAAGEA